MIKKLFAVALILPHFAIFMAAGIYEYKRWRKIDAEIRPSFTQFLSRTTPVDEDRVAEPAKTAKDRNMEIDKT